MELWERNRPVIGVSTNFYRLVKPEDPLLDIRRPMRFGSPAHSCGEVR